MTALVRDERGTSLRAIARPRVEAPDDVLVRVACAGICRTDVWAADGALPTSVPVVLGHELAGFVHAMGDDVRDLAIGDAVTVEPWTACRRCGPCGRGRPCAARRMLGVHRDGAFAELVRVPRDVVHRLPRALPLRVGAYAEPVAASLAAARADLHGPGLVLGRGRVATLTTRVLRARGLDVTLRAPWEAIERGAYAFAVETVASSEALRVAIDAVERGGTIVLKSRDKRAVGLSIGDVVEKELVLRGVEHAPFADAIAMLDEALVGDLLGDAFALRDHEAAFARARASEGEKVMFVLDQERA